MPFRARGSGDPRGSPGRRQRRPDIAQHPRLLREAHRLQHGVTEPGAANSHGADASRRCAYRLRRARLDGRLDLCRRQPLLRDHRRRWQVQHHRRAARELHPSSDPILYRPHSATRSCCGRQAHESDHRFEKAIGDLAKLAGRVLMQASDKSARSCKAVQRDQQKTGDPSRRCPMSELDRVRREMAAVLQQPGVHPDPSLRITRRTFVHRSCLTGAATVAQTFAWWPLLNTIDVAYAAEQPFKFAWVSDTHLYPRSLNTRFVEKVVRAANEVQAMNPPADFMIFGGDLAQLGKIEELELGNELLKEIKTRKVFIPGEHDWYLDMGKKWGELFGQPNWTFDHKGVRFVGLDTVSRGPDYWTVRKMTPEERMGHMATLDGSVAGPWAGVGRDQLDWLQKILADWDKSRPVVIFSHNPLYEYYPPWNFWVRDWREVNDVLKPYTKVTNIHGHVHQVLYNEIGTMRSIGMLATSWPWPYAPEGVPKLTKPMIRADPGDFYDGVGRSEISLNNDRIENEYIMWGRKQVFVQSAPDSSLSQPEILRPRIADQIGPY